MIVARELILKSHDPHYVNAQLQDPHGCGSEFSTDATVTIF